MSQPTTIWILMQRNRVRKDGQWSEWERELVYGNFFYVHHPKALEVLTDFIERKAFAYTPKEAAE